MGEIETMILLILFLTFYFNNQYMEIKNNTYFVKNEYTSNIDEIKEKYSTYFIQFSLLEESSNCHSNQILYPNKNNFKNFPVFQYLKIIDLLNKSPEQSLYQHQTLFTSFKKVLFECKEEFNFADEHLANVYEYEKVFSNYIANEKYPIEIELLKLYNLLEESHISIGNDNYKLLIFSFPSILAPYDENLNENNKNLYSTNHLIFLTNPTTNDFVGFIRIVMYTSKPIYQNHILKTYYDKELSIKEKNTNNNYKEQFGLIGMLLVAPSYRNKKIGTYLLQKTIEICKNYKNSKIEKDKLYKIELTTNIEKNKTAFNLYTSFNFKIIEQNENKIKMRMILE